MDSLDPAGLAFHHSCDCGPDSGHSSDLDSSAFTQALAIAHVANGMDPMAAALQAQIDAPLLLPLLG